MTKEEMKDCIKPFQGCEGLIFLSVDKNHTTVALLPDAFIKLIGTSPCVISPEQDKRFSAEVIEDGIKFCASFDKYDLKKYLEGEI